MELVFCKYPLEHTALNKYFYSYQCSPVALKLLISSYFKGIMEISSKIYIFCIIYKTHNTSF